MNYSFDKDERLCSNEKIKSLFNTGKSFTNYPFLIFWKTVENNQSFRAQIAFSIPKRKLKRAVDRNYVKRRIKESYRLRKRDLYRFLEDQNIQIEILLVYIKDEKFSYQQLDEKVKTMLMKLEKEIIRHLS